MHDIYQADAPQLHHLNQISDPTRNKDDELEAAAALFGY